jgi:hypothetical protein
LEVIVVDEMLKDQLYKDIQSFFDSNSVLIVGSGLSCAEGLPGMWSLAVELLKKVPEEIKRESLDEWDVIKNELCNSDGLIKDEANLEAVLLKYPPNEDIEEAIRRITTAFIKEEELKAIQKAICGEKRLRFSNFIKRFRIPEAGLVVVCTNYDRLVEIACELEGIPVDNLFYGKNISHLDEKKSQMSFCEGLERNGKTVKRIFTRKVLVYKPHGCLNWYLSEGKPINSSFDLNLERLVITPGANKFRTGYNSPFDIHREKANNAIDQAAKFIVVGYGFNDEHLETHLKKRISNGVPTLLLTRSLSQNTRKVIEDNHNVIALSYFNDDKTEGTEIIFKNTSYNIDNLNLWDIDNLIKAVF